MASTTAATAAAAVDDDGWIYPRHHDYQLHISGLFTVKDRRLENPYPRNKEFSKEELLTIKPSDVKRYLLWKAYGTTTPDFSNTELRVTTARGESLKKYKQAISWFMPNKHVAWIEDIGGNPTRHTSVSAVIKKVIDMEMKGMGVAANDKRPYSEVEFFMVLDLFRRKVDFDHQIKYPSMTLWAYHLIHRMDDTSHFPVNAPHGSLSLIHI